MAKNDKPGLRKTFKTKTPYSGKLHYPEQMTEAQARKMMESGKAMLDRLRARKGKNPFPKPKPKKPMTPMKKQSRKK